MAGVSVLLVTHQSEVALDACLSELPSAEVAEVVVVDNASTDGSPDVAGKHGALVIKSTANRGFAWAANRAAEAARADILCFLNPDCRLGAEVLAAASESLGGGRLACAAPSLDEGNIVVNGRQPGYTRIKLLADVLETAWGDSPVVRWLRRRPRHHDQTWWWAHGACLLMGRKSFLGLGGFDEGYKLYMEDVDLGRRVSFAGGRVIGLPQRVLHSRSGSSSITPDHRRRLILEGRIRFGSVHYGTWFAAGLRLLAKPADPVRRCLGGRRTERSP